MATLKFEITDEALALAAQGLSDGETDQEKVENYLLSIVQERTQSAKRDQVISINKADIEAVSADVSVTRESK